MTLLSKTATGFGSLRSLTWSFSTTTTNGNPGAGFIRFDSATPEDIGYSYISDTAIGGRDVSAILLSLKENDYLIIEQAGNPACSLSFRLDDVPVDNLGYVTLSISVSNVGTLPTNNLDCAVYVQFTGNDANVVHVNINNEFSSVSQKESPIDADLILIEDSETNGSKKYVQIGSLSNIEKPSTPTDDGKVVIASSGNFAYTKGTSYQVLVTNADASSYAWTKITENNVDESASLTASKLASATTKISVSAATAPVIGQLLTATSDTTAIWQSPETIISPTPGSTENNYSPTGWSSATIVRLNPIGSSSITGFSSVASATRKTLINISSNDITLYNQDSASTDVNRIIVNGGLVLGQNDTAVIWYDATDGRWRVIGQQV